MAITPSIEVEKAVVLTVLRRSTPAVVVEQGNSLVPYNIPTEEMLVNQATVLVPERSNHLIDATMGKVLAVVAGRVATPNLVAWTFTLDGHDFYALRLGDDITLIYDVSTQQWAEWGEDRYLTAGLIDTEGRWNLSTGINWEGIGALAYSLGSDIVAGDDTAGTIYVFDPATDEDYKWNTQSFEPFHRVAQGQLLMTGRDSSPVWGVQLSGSTGEQWTGSLVNVELLSSDDMGNTYFSHGEVQVPQGSYNFRLDWNSLGAMNNPGRIFKIIDDGAIVRLDALDAYDRDGNV